MRKNRLCLLFIVVIVLSLFCVTPLLAKYFHNEKNNFGVESPEFYFNSDLLEIPQTNGVYPQYKLNDGETKISFKLKNYLDEFRFSNIDIKYVVKITGEVEKTEEGIITGGSINDVIVEFNDLTTGTYKVEVNTVSPYNVTLKADFIIKEEDDAFTYTVNDAIGSSIIQVIITTNAYEGKLNIEWPANVLPDNTDELLKDAIGKNNFFINVSENAEYSLIFLKQDVDQVYSKTDIRVFK